ncbi:MAG: GTP cyclohydrolase II [Moraxella sp.]|nr:GTP cyclohydrolase II [Moraxella sp.]
MSYQFVTQAHLPTAHGDFLIHIFENEQGQEHVLLSHNLPCKDSIPLVRIHSECLTGDAFSSLKCDCGPQLNTAMQLIVAHGAGAILYLRQEGRGIGLTNKIRAYALQDQGHDTLEANLLLGLPADARTYEMCQIMLAHVGVTKAKLLTNNPNKIQGLQDIGIDIVERIPLIVGVNAQNQEYLNIKQQKMGHLINNP